MNYIIDFEQTATPEQIAEYFTTNACTIIREFSHFDLIYLVTCDSEPPTTEIVTSIINDDINILKMLTTPIVDETDSVTIDIQDEKNWWKVFSLKKVDLDDATIDVKKRGGACAIYLLDSGITAAHPEFIDANITNLYSINDNFEDETGHGTALASVMVGKTCSLTNAQLKVCKILDTSGEIRQSSLLAAFDAVAADVLQNPRRMAIVNLSWTIAKNEYIEQKIDQLIDYGVVVVAAVGNSGIPIGDVTPASMERVIAVGSYNQDLQPSDFSNYTGENVISNTQNETNFGALDGWAPGEKIWVATENDEYGYANGTSLSSAIHSSMIAYASMMLLDENNELLDCINDISDMSQKTALNRKDILNLSDAKYSASVNLLSTCFNEFVEVMFPFKPLAVLEFVSGVPQCSRVFSQLAVQSYEVIGNMPDGISVFNGVFKGTTTLADGVDYDVQNVQVKTVLLDGTTATQEVHFFIRLPNYDVADLPTDDPILAIASLICSGGNCGTGCTTGGSNPKTCINCADDKSPFCSCLGAQDVCN